MLAHIKIVGQISFRFALV